MTVFFFTFNLSNNQIKNEVWGMVKCMQTITRYFVYNHLASFISNYIAPKAGYCPALTADSGLGTCDQACSSDADCEGSAKCCSNGCGTVCGKNSCFVYFFLFNFLSLFCVYSYSFLSKHNFKSRFRAVRVPHLRRFPYFFQNFLMQKMQRFLLIAAYIMFEFLCRFYAFFLLSVASHTALNYNNKDFVHTPYTQATPFEICLQI